MLLYSESGHVPKDKLIKQQQSVTQRNYHHVNTVRFQEFKYESESSMIVLCVYRTEVALEIPVIDIIDTLSFFLLFLQQPEWFDVLYCLIKKERN